MSRSFRHKNKIGNTTARSEKKDKRHANRLFRRRTRHALSADINVETLPLFGERFGENPWDFAKDGKHIFDITKWPNLMRK